MSWAQSGLRRTVTLTRSVHWPVVLTRFVVVQPGIRERCSTRAHAVSTVRAILAGLRPVAALHDKAFRLKLHRIPNWTSSFASDRQVQSWMDAPKSHKCIWPANGYLGTAAIAATAILTTDSKPLLGLLSTMQPAHQNKHFIRHPVARNAALHRSC